MRSIRIAATLVLMLAVTLPAWAQDADGQAEVIALYQKAVKLNAAGKTKEAARAYEKAVARARVAFGMEDENTATLMANLANLYTDMGQYARAEPLHKRSLAIRKAKLGNDHLDVATSLNNLAILYKNTGQYVKAESLYKRSLEIREANLGKEHPLVATSLNNLVLCHTSILG